MLTMYAGKYLSAPLSLFISSVLFSEGVASQSTVTVSASSSLPTGHANVVQDNFLGISWELSSFDTLCESSPSIHAIFAPRGLVSPMFLPVSPHTGVYSPRRHGLLYRASCILTWHHRKYPALFVHLHRGKDKLHHPKRDAKLSL